MLKLQLFSYCVTFPGVRGVTRMSYLGAAVSRAAEVLLVYLLKRLRALESSCCAFTRRDARRAPASCRDPPLARMSDGSPGREGIVCRLTCCHDHRTFTKTLLVTRIYNNIEARH